MSRSSVSTRSVHQIAVYGSKRDGNAYGWWWWVTGPNGDSVASAATSQDACLQAARDVAQERGWTLSVDLPARYGARP